MGSGLSLAGFSGEPGSIRASPCSQASLPFPIQEAALDKHHSSGERPRAHQSRQGKLRVHLGWGFRQSCFKAPRLSTCLHESSTSAGRQSWHPGTGHHPGVSPRVSPQPRLSQTTSQTHCWHFQHQPVNTGMTAAQISSRARILINGRHHHPPSPCSWSRSTEGREIRGWGHGAGLPVGRRAAFGIPKLPSIHGGGCHPHPQLQREGKSSFASGEGISHR